MSPQPRPLHGEQRDAVDPRDSVWLAASAGTGKTHVLSSRVLRLLLQPGTEPSQILCLTFTKAGAAEMAVRVSETLAQWVRMPETELFAHLEAIGADAGPEALARARTLFARVLDCPGGGLRIDTIHAFAQWLLSAFPQEAGLVPGTRAMEDRDRDRLFREVLARFVADADERGDTSVLATIDRFSLDKGPDKAEAWLLRCASAHDLWFGADAWQPPMRDRVDVLLGLTPGAGAAEIEAACADGPFDNEALRCCLSAYSQWNGKKGQEGRVVIADWLSAAPAQRAAMLDELHRVLFTLKDTVKDVPSLEKFESHFGEAAQRVLECMLAIRELRILIELAGWMAPALELGRKFALEWDAAKTREGFVDFDDQIRRASELLTDEGLSPWIRYKLDRQFDHILVDEAQDTNEAQWRIILDGLTSEFFAGHGQHDDKLRTLFVVGDYKQAIFGFQGTSPQNFRAAQDRVRRAMDDAFDNAVAARGRAPRKLKELGLDRSFRTAQPVLDFVDAAIDAIGHERFGLDRHPGRHLGDERPGLVTLWPPVVAEPDPSDPDDGDEPMEPAEEGRQTWLPRSDRMLADRIALQVRDWLRDGYPLAKGGRRNATAGDIMVLVRQRKELAALIVARLYARGVPVAGIDRLRLGGPLAVKDLMAALRFAAQPLDDLNLANLLVSPLLGWSQDDLLRHGWRAPKVRLWEHLHDSGDDEVRRTLDRLGELLALADFEPPQALLQWILAGPWRGRKALVARLGREANDPIDELLNAALAYASANTPSLQGFIQWFDLGDGDLKRDAGAGADQVRVMTVHGSKGLEAPIVILADAAGNPDRQRGGLDELPERVPGGGKGRKVPLPGVTKDQLVGRLGDAAARAADEEREEHWRLLYVAMTRAQEALFIGGSLMPSDKGAAAAESWFAKLEPLFTGEPIADGLWGHRREIGARPDPLPVEPDDADADRPELPQWAATPIGPEPRPPRPLAPSSAGEDLGAAPPLPSEALKAAARRGTLVHALLERLPELPVEAREGGAMRWLARQAADLSDEARTEIAAAALRVLDTPDWADLFGPDALAEVPLAATVGGRVIAGTADRLLVTKERVLLVDFKTAARPPQRLEDVPLSTVRQMAAYVAALAAIYPDRRVEAAVLYTHTPQLFVLPAALVEQHKPALSPAE